jgi:hypothetical protein
MVPFYFIRMMNCVNMMVLSSFVVRSVKSIPLVREATGAPPVARVVKSPRGGTCPEARLGS